MDDEQYEQMQDEQMQEQTQKYKPNYSYNQLGPQNIPDALKNRDNNLLNDLRKNKEQKEGQNTNEDSPLKKKDGLENKNDKEEQNSKDTNDNKEKINTNSSLFDKIDKKDKKDKKNGKDSKDKKGIEKFFKGKTRLKIKLIIAGICLGLILLAFVIVAAMILYNTLMTSLVIHFGVKEVDLVGETGDTGLWIDDKYYKDENGNERGLDDYTYPDGTKVEGVKTVLGKACDKSTIQYWWDSIFSNSFGNNPCRLLNFIWGYSEKEEKSKPGLKIDQSLIIATIFYAYDEQPGYDSYDNPSTVGQKTVSTDHYNTLKSILENGILTKKDVTRIIDSTIYNNVYPYLYYDQKKKQCYFGKVESYYTSLQKWEIFMRFDQREDNQNYYISGKVSGSGNGYRGTGYEYEKNMNSAWLSSSPECREHSFFTSRDFYGPVDLSMYLQKIPENEIFTTNKITFYAGSRRFSNGYYDVEMDYRNGFVYNKYQTFKMAIDSGLKNYEYNEMSTPKRIEQLIQTIEERKSDFDEILFNSSSSNGSLIATPINSNVVSPGEVLTVDKYCALVDKGIAPQLQINVTDCTDRPLAIVTLKEYIMGVTLAEIGYKADNPNYVKTQMTAAISYTLGRRGNYKNTQYFQMRSGSCDQNWCDIYQGCSQTSDGGYRYSNGRILYATVPGVVSSSINKGSCNIGGSYRSGYYKCPLSAQQLEAYSALYDEASKYVVSRGDSGYNGAYIDKVQHVWAAKASTGEDFVQILTEEYGPNGSTIHNCSEYK